MGVWAMGNYSPAGECKRGGVEGLSLDEPEVERPGGIHGSGSQQPQEQLAEG